MKFLFWILVSNLFKKLKFSLHNNIFSRSCLIQIWINLKNPTFWVEIHFLNYCFWSLIYSKNWNFPFITFFLHILLNSNMYKYWKSACNFVTIFLWSEILRNICSNRHMVHLPLLIKREYQDHQGKKCSNFKNLIHFKNSLIHYKYAILWLCSQLVSFISLQLL